MTALEEYNTNRMETHAWAGVRMNGEVVVLVDRDIADAMRDELLEELAEADRRQAVHLDEIRRLEAEAARLREREPSDVEYEASRYRHLYEAESRIRKHLDAEVERLRWMLREAWENQDIPERWHLAEDWLADLARRYEEAHQNPVTKHDGDAQFHFGEEAQDD